MSNTTYFFIAGKSGGHIVPALTVARTILDEQPKTRLVFCTTTSCLDAQIVEDHTWINRHCTLPLTSLPRRATHLPIFIVRALLSLIKSFYLLAKYKPKKIISMGGIVSLPLCMAAFCLRIPIELYELNVVPGRAVQWLSWLAKKINIVFDQSARYLPATRCTHVDYPVRFAPTENMTTADARRQLEMDPDKPTLVILGGSQGSAKLNHFIKELFQRHPELRNTIQVIHQTGARHASELQSWYAAQQITARAFAYRDDLAPVYAAADLIICRAGAGTLFEVTSFAKPCITIPLVTATTDHQLHNAHAMVQRHPNIVRVLEQEELEKDPEKLFMLIRMVLHKRI